MVEALPEDQIIKAKIETNVDKPSTALKTKRRKKVVWSVNVLTVVLYMVDPKYILCEGKYKQVSKRFRKACETVLRVIVHEATQYIEYSAPLVMDLERQYL